jgi:leucyl/phenylalanyl-tRNA--protein transferase
VARIPWLGTDPQLFPPLERALRSPNGLLAAGGDLCVTRLLAAYRRGIFPWYEEPEPILWWSPDPRTVLFPAELHLSASLRKLLARRSFDLSADTAFDRVVAACAEPRSPGGGTWIGPEMQRAYTALWRAGHAHSVEVWRDGQLAGGLYGVACGRVFFGESMFTRVPNASKVALALLVAHLQRWGCALIDCQQDTAHLRSLGARCIARAEFRDILAANIDQPGPPSPWHMDWSIGEQAWATR